MLGALLGQVDLFEQAINDGAPPGAQAAESAK
jgi:hypothetical protein